MVGEFALKNGDKRAGVKASRIVLAISGFAAECAEKKDPFRSKGHK